MRRWLAATLAATLMGAAPDAGVEDGGDAGAMAPRPPPAPDLPDYVPPREIVDGMSLGDGGEDEGEVCYRESDHTRLVLTLQLAEPLSDDRARAAYDTGWLDSADAHAPILATLRERAARAETSARVARARAEGAREGRMERAFEAGGWILVGLVAGAGGVGVVELLR